MSDKFKGKFVCGVCGEVMQMGQYSCAHDTFILKLKERIEKLEQLNENNTETSD